MGHIGSSLSKHYKELALGENSVSFKTAYKFPQYKDFAPPFTYWGECPILFSFDPRIEKRNELVEIMDGLAFLVPFLYSEKFQKNEKNFILPVEAEKILPEGIREFNYSIYSTDSRDKSEHSRICYVMMDYFEDVTTAESWQKNCQNLRGISERYEIVNVIMNTVLTNRNKDESLNLFFEGVRTMPDNCRFMSQTNFFEQKNIKGSRLIILNDEDVILKSPWEEICIMKNGRIEKNILHPDDKFVQRFHIYPGVRKEIYRHNRNYSSDFQRVFATELSRILKMVNGPEDYLDKNYRRQLQDILIAL